jgi:predicted amidohydrolase YtcJ
VTGDSGALEVGGHADFVAWGADPADCVPEDVVELPVHLTVVDGRIAHQTV